MALEFLEDFCTPFIELTVFKMTQNSEKKKRKAESMKKTFSLPKGAAKKSKTMACVAGCNF